MAIRVLQSVFAAAHTHTEVEVSEVSISPAVRAQLIRSPESRLCAEARHESLSLLTSHLLIPRARLQDNLAELDKPPVLLTGFDF